MDQSFNCPNCGATNEYAGFGDTVRCSYCGMDVHPPAEMVNQAALTRATSNAKVLIGLFVVVVVVIPLCLTMGGTLLGILGSLIGIAAGILGAIVALFSGH